MPAQSQLLDTERERRQQAEEARRVEAGEPERETRVRGERKDLPIDDITWAEIVAAGRKVGCDLSAQI